MFFLAGNFFTLLVGLPFQIYVARVLGVEALGIFSLLEGGVGLVAGLVALGISPTLPKFIPHHLERREFGSIRQLVRRGFWTLLLVGTLTYTALVLLLGPVLRHWPELAPYRPVVIAMGLMVPLSLLIFFLQQGLRGFHEIRHMVIGSSFLQLTAKVLITVVAFAAGWRLGGYVVAVLVSTCIAIAWLGAGFRRKLASLPAEGNAARETGPDREWRRYGLVQYSNSLAGLGAQYLDRFLLAAVASASEVGVLAVIKQLQQLPAVFLQIFISVAAPMFSALHSRQDGAERQHLYGLATDWVVKAAAPLLIFLLIYVGPVLGLFGAEFAKQGAWPLRVVVLAQVINVVCGPVGTVLNMSGHEGKLLRIVAFQTLVAAGLLIALTPWLGLMGIAISMAVSITYNNLGSLLVARRNLGLRWFDGRYRKWVLPTVLAAISGVLGDRLLLSHGTIGLASSLVVCYVVFYAGLLAQGLHQDDRELLRQIRSMLTQPFQKSA